MNDKDKEEFDKWFISCRDSSFAVFLRENYPDAGIKWDRESARGAWQAACDYKEKELDILKLEYDKLTDWASEYVAENTKLNQEIEKFKGYLEAWGKDE
jgi:hypothetical protein